ncbi:MAG: hypothetical protein KAT35_01890 [Candidatus Aenigmarchaeota archaeon]|nr:hypothetical protein [Candidatus Aenigmarchaeota archaeon]
MEKIKTRKKVNETRELKEVLSDLRVVERALDKVAKVKGNLSKPVASEVGRANKTMKKLKERVRDVLASLTPI